jgi:hypothetical protein
MLWVCVAACGELAESFAWMVKLAVPETAGVPLIAPVRASESPEGNCPDATLHVYGAVPPLAVRATWYAVFTVPEGRVVVVIASGVGAGALATAMVSERVAVCGEPAESLACTAKE